MPTDRPQSIVLLAMLLLMAILVGAVLLEKSWKGGPEGERLPAAGPVPRASLLPAGEGPLSEFDAAFVLMRPLDVARIGGAARFDLPLGSEHGALTYNAQPFGENRHLGDDLNGIGGWDSDLGDPVHAVADGRVLFAGWPSDGWGNLIIVAHRLEDGRVVQSVYAHLDAVFVAVDDRVRRGQRIGSVGKGAGQYLAHLHFEMRDTLSLNPGAGYADGPLDRVSPGEFIEAHRGAPATALSPAPDDRRDAPAQEGLEIRVERPAGDGEGGAAAGKGETVRELRQ